MAPKHPKSTGLGADAFFQSPVTAKPKTVSFPASNSGPDMLSSSLSTEEKSERRSFNLRLSTLRLLDEVQIKTMREGNKQTLSSIVERGIALVAKDMGISDEMNKRVKDDLGKGIGDRSGVRADE